MKNILIVIIISVFITNPSLVAQVYTPFPDSNAMWTDRIFDPSCNLTAECSINQYRISGDTVINGTLYKKLTKSGYLIDQNYQYNYYPD